MGIKNFFRKIGNGLRKAGRFVRDKVFPTVGRIAKPIFNLIGTLPGKIGMIGQIGSGIASILHGATEKIPNPEMRDKIGKIIDNGNNKFQGAIDKGKKLANSANAAVETRKDIANHLRDGIKKLPLDQGFYKK